VWPNELSVSFYRRAGFRDTTEVAESPDDQPPLICPLWIWSQEVRSGVDRERLGGKMYGQRHEYPVVQHYDLAYGEGSHQDLAWFGQAAEVWRPMVPSYSTCTILNHPLS
jgi:hypothetical protein